MEESGYVEGTIALFEEMREAYGADRVGIVLQSYLRDRGADLEHLVDGRLPDPDREGRLLGGCPTRSTGRSAEIDAGLRPRRARAPRAGPPAGDCHPRSGGHRRGQGAGCRARHRPNIVRVPDALRRPRRPPGRPGSRRLPGAPYVPYGGDWFFYFLGCIRRIPGGLARRVSTRLGRPRRIAA